MPENHQIQKTLKQVQVEIKVLEQAQDLKKIVIKNSKQ